MSDSYKLIMDFGVINPLEKLNFQKKSKKISPSTLLGRKKHTLSLPLGKRVQILGGSDRISCMHFCGHLEPYPLPP